jgi:hypothetical protein
MKALIAAAAAAVFVAGAAPAFARDHDHHDHRMAAPPPRRAVYAHRFRQGQIWHGHHLVYRGGYWGYYQPHNGAQLFIHINI